METFDNIDGQMLGAFVDGLLDDEHSALVIKAMEDDPEIKDQVYQLRRAKDLMKLGFGNATAPSGKQQAAKPSFWKSSIPAIAASITFLTVSLLAGSVGYYYGGQANTTIASSVNLEQTHRVVVHVRKADMKQFIQAINYTKTFIKENDTEDQIEVVAHGKAVDLMRVGVSPFEDEIVDLISNHPNVSFVACSNGIRDIRKKGIEPVMIVGVKTDMPAMDHIIGRVQAGWTYTRVDSLS
jgi:intracellular sulfur oxidation DsrE/DsrF family protein